MSPDVLRQRRDFYAIALGLLLFELARGYIQKDANFPGLLPVRFANPCWFLWAAWAGFAYFFVRYHMLSPSNPWHMYREDAHGQAGDTKAVRKIAASKATDPGEQRDLLNPAGHVPKLEFGNKTVRISLNALMRHRIYNFNGNHTVKHFAGGSTFDLTARERRIVTGAMLWGYLAALWRERTFTDYLLPYVVGIITVGVAVARWLQGETHLCVPWV
jgi:hypothetical protein